MKLSYGISFDDFRALQPRPVVRPGKSSGFAGLVVLCALVAGLGVYAWSKGFGIGMFGVLAGLGVTGVIAGYLYEWHTIRKNGEKYERNIELAYQQVHCRDQRNFETSDTGFTMSCRCGTLTRPWTELKHFTEGEKWFALGTKGVAQIIPKSAFPVESARTEFRALINEKLNADRPLTLRHFDVLCSAEERRAAQFLHIRKGGGWRPLLKVAVTLALLVWALVVLWRTMPNPAFLAGLSGGLAVYVLKIVRRRRRMRLAGVVRIHFGPEGLYLQDRNTQARSAWENHIGYLEDSKLLLLYYNPRLYRIIPKRLLTGPAAEFESLVKAKISPYNYRQPIPIKTAEELKGTQV